MKLHQIVPLLYQRGAFAHLPDKVQALRAAGIEVVISLWHEDPDMPAVVTYLHHPVPDGQRVDAGLYGGLAKIAAEYIWTGRPVLIHCHAGRNRSGLLSALTVRELYDCSGREALEVVRRGRPGALANEHFVRYLEGLGVPT